MNNELNRLKRILGEMAFIAMDCSRLATNIAETGQNEDPYHDGRRDMAKNIAERMTTILKGVRLGHADLAAP